MILNFEVKRSNSVFRFVEMSAPFIDTVNELDDNFENISILVSAGDEEGNSIDKVAILDMNLLDSGLHMNIRESLLITADTISSETSEAMLYILDRYVNDEDKRRGDEDFDPYALKKAERNYLSGDDMAADKAICATCTLYIEHLYVYPKFHNIGIEEYLLNNLSEIIAHFLNYYPHCAAIIPIPLSLTETDDGMEWSVIDDPDMQADIVKVIEKCKFEHTEEGYYVRNYGAEPYYGRE